MNILIKFPSRGRAEQLIDCVKKYVRLADDLTNISFLFSFDTDDSTYNYASFVGELQRACGPCARTIVYGLSESKIHAVNRDMIDYKSQWDIILLASDDMVPQQKGYDTIIIDDMHQHFPDTDGVLWYPDGYRSDIITLSIMGHQYYDRFGYLYHPSYKSFYCDNEFTEVCVKLGKFHKSDRVLISHNHPDNIKNTAYDMLYNHNAKFFTEDQHTFDYRHSINFELP